MGRAAADLHETFRALGTASRIVATASRTAAPVDVPDSRVLIRTGPERAFFSTGLLSQGTEWVREADIIHGHGFYVSTNWILGRTARAQGKPLVLHPHGMFEPWILNRSRGKKKIAHLLFENANFRGARLWRALTGKEADQIRAQGITAPIVVAPNGVDPAPFDAHARTESRESTQRTALFLGRLHPKKGIDLLIQAWAALPVAVREDWNLVIAGPDEGGYKARLLDLVCSHSLEKEISFPGLITGDAKIGLLTNSDLFLLTSHSEGFSVAILEAMAARVPVIATEACNFPDLFEEGGGWKCEPEIVSIGETLRQALNAGDEELRQRGQAGRNLLDASYTWKSAARTLLDACGEYCT